MPAASKEPGPRKGCGQDATTLYQPPGGCFNSLGPLATSIIQRSIKAAVPWGLEDWPCTQQPRDQGEKLTFVVCSSVVAQNLAHEVELLTPVLGASTSAHLTGFLFEALEYILFLVF